MSATASGSEEPRAHDEPQAAACSVILMKPVLVGFFTVTAPAYVHFTGPVHIQLETTLYASPKIRTRFKPI